MPAVFSPGEAETRPVDPDAIVYTTGDKVGELLGIAPGEPVLAAADSSASGFYISGTDLREHGFESGDSIFVFSDLYPLGETFTIGTPVVEDVSGTKYVKLPVTLDSGAAGTNDAFASYTTVANTEIQNKTIFTNGKKRGVTKDIVNKHIRRIQDRIDNYTHNAWRPYLVSAEYLNFDTYKPYRRRYYTDYVGTVPLLFRNVQQILRLEVWQGDSYRELASAEARLEIVDESALSAASIYFGLTNGSVVRLEEGSDASTKWRADFDKVSAAQNLADLINKEDRVSKAAVEFAPTFTVEGSTSNVAAHNELLASANSDYGNGKLKVTSLRQTNGGENVSIAASDLTNLTIKQISSKSTTTGVHPTSLTVVSHIGTTIDTVQDPSGIFAAGDSVYQSNGDLLGVVSSLGATSIVLTSTVNFYDAVVGGALHTARLADSTTQTVLSVASTDGFLPQGLIMIVNGDTTRVAQYTGKTSTTFTGVSNMSGGNSFIPNIGGSSGSGVKGTTVTQYALQSDIGAFSDAGGDQARLKDWWLDHEMGIVYFNNSYPYFEWNAVKASYIYGERYLEKAIEEAATKLVASELLMSDDRSVLIPEGTQNIDLGSKAQLFRREAMEILSRYKEVVVFA
jgi:hypothetical protein